MKPRKVKYKTVKIAEPTYLRAKDYSAVSGVRLQHILSQALADYLRAAGATV